MNKEVISCSKAPGAIGPYSQAIKAGGFLFVSGQLPVHPETGLFDDEIVNQTHQALTNLKAIIEEAGLTMEHVVKATVYLDNMADFGEMNAVYATYFTKNPPARVCVEVARLPKNVKVEIDAIVACDPL